MTEETTDYNRLLEDIPAAPAALTSCSDCPWRASQMDTIDEKLEGVDQTFGRDNLTKHWRRAAKDGTAMRCHQTTPGYYFYTETHADAGLVEPSEFKGDGHRQCSGILQMVKNELQKISKYKSHEDYLAANPTGLTADVAHRFLKLWENPESSGRPFRWPNDSEDLVDPADFIDIESIEWTMDVHQIADMRNFIELFTPSAAHCECQFCANHENIHPAETVIMATGDRVRVDRSIAVVVDAFGYAGVNTSASCENIAPAWRELDLYSFLIHRDYPTGNVNYSTPLREGGAFVRFSTMTKTGKAIAQYLGNVYTVDAHKTVAQVTFPVSDSQRIAREIREIADRF